jgi:hypothetical protein
MAATVADVGVEVIGSRGAAAAVLDVMMEGWIRGAHGSELRWALGIGALRLHHPLLQVRVPVVLHLVVCPPRQLHRNLRPPEILIHQQHHGWHEMC